MLIRKYKIGEMLEVGFTILGLLLGISNMNKEANSLTDTRMVDLSVVGALMANQSMKCYMPLKEWE